MSWSVLIGLALLATAASASAAPSDNATLAPALDNATAAHAAQLAHEKQRRAVMRKVAGASLAIILVLICFVVGVMIVTRRLRIRYLHYDRPVTFNRLWDVWWGGGRDREGPPKS